MIHLVVRQVTCTTRIENVANRRTLLALWATMTKILALTLLPIVVMSLTSDFTKTLKSQGWKTDG